MKILLDKAKPCSDKTVYAEIRPEGLNRFLVVRETVFKAPDGHKKPRPFVLKSRDKAP